MNTYKREQKTVCPYITKQLEDCWTTEMKSINIKYVVYYCGEHYTECRIYKDLSPNNGRGADNHLTMVLQEA